VEPCTSFPGPTRAGVSRAFVLRVGTTPSSFEFLDFEDLDRFLSTTAPEWKSFFITALKTGLRVGELLALEWKDLDLTVRRTLWRKQEGPPKGGRSRASRVSLKALERRGHATIDMTMRYAHPSPEVN
jgi:integrase